MIIINGDVKKRHNVTIKGSGEKTLVFIHGFASSQKAWQWITPAFEATHTLILLDLVGSGESDMEAYDEQRYQSLKSHVEDISEVLSTLDVEEATVIGHSLGGMIALMLANHRPDLVKQVVLIGASPRYINDLPDYYGGFNQEDVDTILEMMEVNYVGWASYLSSIVVPPAVSESSMKYVESSFLASDHKVTYQLLQMTLMGDYRAILKEVTVDTLILQCSDDSFVPIEVAEYMDNEIKNSSLHILSSKGHYPQLSNPAETADVIKRSLR